jgi:hypothetical protein
VAVNRIGSFFYGTMLAIFLLAFYAKRVGSTAVFYAALISLAAVTVCALYTDMAWLWWNVVGVSVGVVSGLVLQAFLPPRASPGGRASRPPAAGILPDAR